MELKFVQTNLKHHRNAQVVLQEFIRAKMITVALVSDPYNVGLNGWRYDSSGGAAIGILRPGLSIADVEIGNGYVCATVGGVLYLYSCYAPPSPSAPGSEKLLDNIVVSTAGYRGTGLDVVVAGDFNAHSTTWGDRRNDHGGEALCAFADSLGLAIANVGQEPTFFMRGGGSIVDVILVSEAASGRLREWRVRTDIENLSDHHHITFSYSDRRATSVSGAASGNRGAARRRLGWSTARMDVELLAAAVVDSESPELPP